MKPQTVTFAFTRDKGNITRMGKGSILQPESRFTGGTIRWYEDKPKQKDN